MKYSSIADFPGECRTSGSQLVFNCPACDGKFKLYVNPANGFWLCFKCGDKGKVEIGGSADVHDEGKAIMALLTREDAPQWGEVDLPTFTALSERALRYLAKRGIPEAVARKHGMVEWEDKFRIIIPYWDEAGRLVYWNSRAYSDNLAQGPKYIAAPGKHPLYVLGAADAKRCFVVEGVFDAIAVHQAAPHQRVIAIGGKSLPRYLRADLTKAAGDATIVVGLDPDALAEALDLTVKLGTIWLLDLPADPADLWVTDPDELRRLLA